MQPSIENRLRALESRRRALRYLPPLVIRSSDDPTEAMRAYREQHHAEPLRVFRVVRAPCKPPG